MVEIRPCSFVAGPSSRIKSSNILSSYGSKESQRHRVAMHRKNSTFSKGDDVESSNVVFDRPDPAKEGNDVIVLHPGSRNLRLGLASSTLPVTVPHVVARRQRSKVQLQPRYPDVDPKIVESYAEDSEAIIKARMKAYKFRSVPNGTQQVQSFNDGSEAETIADHNDPYRVDWLDPSKLKDDAVYGERAFLIPSDCEEFEVFHPFENGRFNSRLYNSVEARLCDIEFIWSSSIESELKISRDELQQFNVVLIIPDIFVKQEVEQLIDVLTNRLKFNAFTLMLESTCAAFGAGISHACVVDMGAQKTSIACVEDGYVVPESRYHLNFGGDNITEIFYYLLQYRAHFPYQELDLNKSHDYFTVESMKENYCTLYEGDIVVQHFDCYIRSPNTPTRLYKFKIYDEAMAAVISAYFPRPFMLTFPTTPATYCESDSPLSRKQMPQIAQEKGRPPYLHPIFGKMVDIGQDAGATPSPQKDALPPVVPETGSTEDVTMEEAEPSMIPLDNAIVMSIASTSAKLMASAKQDNANADAELIITNVDGDRIRKMYSSILLVGGGLSSFPGSSKYLKDHVSNAYEYLMPELFPNLSLKMDTVEVVANPRDIDPQVVTWKGGAISARLESILSDAWISNAEWQSFGASTFKDRLLFEW